VLSCVQPHQGRPNRWVLIYSDSRKVSGVVLLMLRKSLLFLNPLQPFAFHCSELQLRPHCQNLLEQYLGAYCQSLHGLFALTFLKALVFYKKKQEHNQTQYFYIISKMAAHLKNCADKVCLERINFWLLCTASWIVCVGTPCLFSMRCFQVAPSGDQCVCSLEPARDRSRQGVIDGQSESLFWGSGGASRCGCLPGINHEPGFNKQNHHLQDFARRSHLSSERGST
jgi:hypothetical protein